MLHAQQFSTKVNVVLPVHENKIQTSVLFLLCKTTSLHFPPQLVEVQIARSELEVLALEIVNIEEISGGFSENKNTLKILFHRFTANFLPHHPHPLPRVLKPTISRFK